MDKLAAAARQNVDFIMRADCVCALHVPCLLSNEKRVNNKINFIPTIESEKKRARQTHN